MIFLYNPLTINITKEFLNMTVFEVLRNYKLSKDKINFLDTNNFLLVNNSVVHKDFLFKKISKLLIVQEKYEEIDYELYDYQLQILYEDNYLLIINKPKGFIVHSKSENNTICNMVASYFYKSMQNYKIKVCHRLDKMTTGCLIFAKDIVTHSAICNMFENNMVTKKYFAVVEGKLKKMTISGKISSDRHINGKMIFKPSIDGCKTIINKVEPLEKNSLVECIIEGGKKHQIRVSLGFINHPLYGDNMYGSKINAPYYLHAAKVTFMHPLTKETIDVDAPLPDEFKKFIKR